MSCSDRAEARPRSSTEHPASAADAEVTRPPSVSVVEELPPSPLSPSVSPTETAAAVSVVHDASPPDDDDTGDGAALQPPERAPAAADDGEGAGDARPSTETTEPTLAAAPAEPPVVVARDIRTLPVQTESAPEPPAEAAVTEMLPPEPTAEPLPAAAGDNATAAAREQLLVPETGSGEDIQPFNEWASKRVEETQKKTGGRLQVTSVVCPYFCYRHRVLFC